MIYLKLKSGSCTNYFHCFVDTYPVLLKEKFSRCPVKMDDPELVLCQAHGQARVVADFLHENGNCSSKYEILRNVLNHVRCPLYQICAIFQILLL